MAKFRTDWTDDCFEDYSSEEEWINAYPDDPCPNCGKPDNPLESICINCGTKNTL